MSDQIKPLKECLIEIGFWESGDFGDPAIDEKAASLVLDAIQRKLAPGVVILFQIPKINQPAREAQLVCGNYSHTLASGQNLNEAICHAALALPGFLQQYPECGH